MGRGLPGACRGGCGYASLSSRVRCVTGQAFELSSGWERLLLDYLHARQYSFSLSYLSPSLPSISNFYQKLSALLGTVGETVEATQHTRSLADCLDGEMRHGQEIFQQQYKIICAQMSKEMQQPEEVLLGGLR